MLLGFGATAGLGAALNQMDYQHKLEDIKDLYREEIANKLGKTVDQVTVSDLETFAKSNQVVNEEITKTKRNRTFGICHLHGCNPGIHECYLGSDGRCCVSMFPALPLAVASAGVVAAGLMDFLAKGAVGLAIYHAIKAPLHWLGDKVLGLDKETTHDRIAALARDREKWQGDQPRAGAWRIRISASGIDKYITANYGANYDELNLAGQSKVADDLSRILPLDRLADGCNKK